MISTAGTNEKNSDTAGSSFVIQCADRDNNIVPMSLFYHQY